MTIAENIKHYRLKYDMTQKDLAKVCGVTEACVSQWESGWSEPRMGCIEKMASHWGLKKSEIIDERNQKEDDPQLAKLEYVFINLTDAGKDFLLSSAEFAMNKFQKDSE